MGKSKKSGKAPSVFRKLILDDIDVSLTQIWYTYMYTVEI